MTDNTATTPQPVTGTLVIPIPRLTISGTVTPPESNAPAAEGVAD
jgi:hypothetical protein